MFRHLKSITGIVTVFVFVTVLTQIGGIAYLAGLAFARARRVKLMNVWPQRFVVLVTAVLCYALMSFFLVPPLAEVMGRVHLPCGTVSAGPLVAATKLTCALNRGYVRPNVDKLITDLSAQVELTFPESKVTTLEGNFPFLNGFPLLPHLSHRDGKKVDIAYFYQRAADGSALAYGSPSALGYFIYERPKNGETSSCAGRWTPLRWDFVGLQPKPPKMRIDEHRTAWMIRWLKNDPRVSKIFIEPYLAARLGVSGGKVRFQGCYAARHDDHIHIEVE